jgi:hypothetical protein
MVVQSLAPWRSVEDRQDFSSHAKPFLSFWRVGPITFVYPSHTLILIEFLESLSNHNYLCNTALSPSLCGHYHRSHYTTAFLLVNALNSQLSLD